MANRKKNWTKEEMDVLRSAVNANPTNPHIEFGSVAQIVKKSRAAVNAKYGRMYGPNRVMTKRRPKAPLESIPVAVQNPAKTADGELEKKPKKKYNALQRFVKRLFNI